MPKKYKLDTNKLKHLLKSEFLFEVDKVYHEEDLPRLLDLNSDDKLVDHLVHEKTCFFIIVEETATHFKKALQQIESIVKKLQENRINVGNIILVGESFRREDRYTVKNRRLYIKVGKKQKPVVISTGSKKISVLFYRMKLG